MRLLDVQAVLDREKDIQRTDPETEVLKDLDDKTTRYAILSHRWGTEVSYKEITKLLKMTGRKRDEVRQRDGYQKIIKSCEQAMKDGYKWLWVDTCCIDKRSSSELSEAINSMYRWYQNSQVCYAYLGDVEESSFPSERNNNKFSKSRGWPEWFVRGWTLQELIAPKRVEFFNRNWMCIGNLRRLASALEKITRIPANILGHGLTSERPSIAQIMSWAADRQTTRVEDRAYSLMGLFGVSMPMLYGEGEKAFQRLQLEIMRASNDQSIFAWDPYGRMPRYGNVLADDPSYFQDCSDIQKVESDQFIDKLTGYVQLHELSDHESESEWRQAAHSQQMPGFVATNAGIQIWLPVIPYRDYPSVFKVILACSDSDGNLITIDLASRGSTYDRSFNATEIRNTYPLFRRLHITYSPDANETPCHLTIDDRGASCHGFTRRSTFPREIINDTVTLSSRTNDLVVVVYANDDTRSRFAIGFGYFSGQGWVHVAHDERFPTQEGHWLDLDRKVYDVMWNARAQHPLRNEPGNNNRSRYDNFVKHAHLPQSIWAARVVWGRWDEGNLKVMVDVEQCPGCCVGPLEWTATYNDRDGLDIPGLMKTVHNSHGLKLDNLRVQLDECSGQRISLGDYGDCSNGNFKRHGNIFEDMPTLDIDPTDTANCPVVFRVSGDEDLPIYLPNQSNLAVTSHKGGNHLVLYHPIGLSIPNNQQLMLQLKALSTRLIDKYLVTTVIHCSEFYVVDSRGKLRDTKAPALKTYSRITETDLYTPLCAIASPQVWRREPACAHRREQFKSIREHFFDLVNMNRRTTDEAIRFFSDMFGLEALGKYTGKIEFFEKLSLMRKSESPRESSEDAAKGGSLLVHRPKSSFLSWAMKRSPSTDNPEAAQDQSPEVVLTLLRNKCQNLATESGVRSHVAAERRSTEREMKAISQTLSAGLLKCISNTFVDADSEHIQAARVRSYIDYDRQVSISSMVQEMMVLQEKLGETTDEDERRALEEDLTGKVLWLCWCGICQEVEHLLPEVVDYIRKEGATNGLKDIGFIIKGIRTYPDDNQVHLQRIMVDAGVGTSKHQLLLDALRNVKYNDSGHQPMLDTPVV